MNFNYGYDVMISVALVVHTWLESSTMK